MSKTLHIVGTVNTLSNIVKDGYENIRYNPNFTVVHVAEEIVSRFPELSAEPNLADKIQGYSEEWSNQSPAQSDHLTRSQWVGVRLYDLKESIQS